MTTPRQVEDGAAASDYRPPPAVRSAVRSGIYEGSVSHHRFGEAEHAFSKRVTMIFADVAEVPALCALHPLWSDCHPAPVQFRRADYLGDPDIPLEESVRRLVEQRTGERPAGPIAILTNVRTWGWLFNPITCYFGYGQGAESVQWMVAEVTNTPWGQRHAYLVGGPGAHELPKALHVSPFSGMDQEYRLCYEEPGEELSVHFDVEEGGRRVLAAGMTLRRQPATRRSLGRVVWSPRRGPMGVSAAIYLEAAALWRKGATFHPNPHPGPLRLRGPLHAGAVRVARGARRR